MDQEHSGSFYYSRTKKRGIVSGGRIEKCQMISERRDTGHNAPKKKSNGVRRGPSVESFKELD